MNILGINAGMGASVCLLRDGRLTLAIEEERLSRIKNTGGFPERGLAHVVENHAEFLADIDYVAICNSTDKVITRDYLLDLYDIRFRPRSRARRARDRVSGMVPTALKRWLRPEQRYPSLVAEVRRRLPDLRLPDAAYRRLRHHDCHAAAAYFGLARDLERPYLVLTADGGGDGECASVSVGQGGRLRRIAGTPSGCSLGNLHSNITHMLGMTPHEHEYKVMGLAPYVPAKHGEQVRRLLAGYLRLDQNTGLAFERLTPERTTWLGLRLTNDMKYLRFDNIAAGLQRFTEDILRQWVINAIKHTGVSDVLLSGGVFMNIKANKSIAELDEVSSVDVFPSCGDESNALGIAFHTYSEANGGRLPEFDTYALGPTPLYDLDAAKAQYGNQVAFERLPSPNRTIGELLARGNIVARCSGPMEFGARALGNRSILSDPRNPEVIDRINYMIKQRDFWMPFAPAVLEEHARDYLVVSDSLPERVSPYMMFGFDTTERHGDLAAALHRADKTARAQIVGRELYPDFHEVISVFKEHTGVPAVMNTSFNLHGHPIVMGTADAVGILLNSSLEHLVVEDWLITKR